MKKIIDILLIVGLTILIVNLFSNKQENNLTNEVIFKTTKNSYTTPAGVGLSIKNNTSSGISLNTCKNININHKGENIIFDKDFCEDITINSNEEKTIDYTMEYKYFFSTGDYTFKINIDNKEYINQFEIKNPGTIRKIFTSLFYAPIYNLMIFLIGIFGGAMGWAIIVLTIIIRLILVYPQHKMMISQNKLQALQPKIKKIQEEFKGQQQVIGIKLMELYKKENVNPMGSCGFLLIQMPILLVLYNVILSIKDVSNGYYLYPFLSNFNLKSVIFDFYGLDLLQAGGLAGLILAISVGFIQFIQISLSLKGKENKDNSGLVLEKKKNESQYSQIMPDTEVINKFMKWGLPVMVGFFTFNLFAGVGIYWGISTLFMLFQQLIVNTKLKKSN